MYRYLHLFILLGLTLVCQQVKSQFSIELVDSSQGQTSFRGLSVVTDKVVWVSGSKGTVGLSKDAGKSWKWMQIPGFEKSDFRDIEAFDKNTAIIMASGTPAVILKTVDGGDNWKVVFRDNRPEMFLDAMDFWDKKRGMLVGDPINGRFVLLETTNGGDSWRVLDSTLCPEAHDSEAVFAASGTSLRCWGKNEFGFVTGGKHTRFLRSRTSTFELYELKLDIIHENSRQGTFSFTIAQQFVFFCGGDYLLDESKDWRSLQAVFADIRFEKFEKLNGYGNDTVYKSVFEKEGYKSCIEFLKEKHKQLFIVMTGTSGTTFLIVPESFSEDSFFVERITEGFHVVRKAKKGKAVFLAGSKGRIAKLNY